MSLMQDHIEFVAHHIVPTIQEEIRIYNYLKGIFVELPSAKSVKKALAKGLVYVDGKPVGSGLWIKEGMKIDLFQEKETALKPFNMEVQVVYEDAFFAVVNKPPGLTTSGNRFDTLENAVQGKLQPSELPDKYVNPRAVHRLDKATSGLVIIAKCRSARVAFGQMLEQREITKKYHALVMGEVVGSGSIDLPIDELSAFSTFKALKSIPSLRSGNLTLVELSPITGRTHQLRIHMAYSGTPILGDTLYGEKGHVLKKKGLFLAAVSLSFIHPFSHIQMDVKIDTPRKFLKRMEIETKQFMKYRSSS